MVTSNANESATPNSNVLKMTKMNDDKVQVVESQEEQPALKQRTKFKLYMIVVAEFVNIQIGLSISSG